MQGLRPEASDLGPLGLHPFLPMLLVTLTCYLTSLGLFLFCNTEMILWEELWED